MDESRYAQRVRDLRPGDVVVVGRNGGVSLWMDTNGSGSVLPMIPLDATMLILSTSDKHYAFVLVEGHLGYVTFNRIFRAF